MNTKIAYSDLNQETPTTNPLVKDIDSIIQSIKTIIYTSSTERVFNHDFGAGIEDYVGELDTPGFAFSIYHRIVAAIRKSEKRITINIGESDVFNDSTNNALYLYLVFTINGYNDKEFNFIEEL